MELRVPVVEFDSLLVEFGREIEEENMIMSEAVSECLTEWVSGEIILASANWRVRANELRIHTFTK